MGKKFDDSTDFDMVYAGMPIVSCRWMTRNETEVVRRSWRERLFTRPWKPWKKTFIRVKRVPIDQVLKIGNTLYAHPAIIQQLKEATKE